MAELSRERTWFRRVSGHIIVKGRLHIQYLARLDWEATDDFEPDETDTSADFERNQFLDLRRPLLLQVWRANFSKSYYLQQVHQPRHVPESPRLFGPWYLEVCSLHSASSRFIGQYAA